MKKSWKTDEINIDYILDSGLLFEINRSVLNIFGIALSIKVDDKGKKSWSFIDNRDNPELTIFDEASFELGKEKLKNFLEEFGNEQDEKRCKKLGWGCQHYARRKK